MFRLSLSVALIALAGLSHAQNCHDAAGQRAKMSNADFSVVSRLLLRGSEHLSATGRCGADLDCLLNRLRNACPMYCEAGGVLAVVINDDHTHSLFGRMYPHVLDLSMYCDQALLHAEAGAWFEVPFFLNEMHLAAQEIEAKAPQR